MREALLCGHKVKINISSGILDFLDDSRSLLPDLFVVLEKTVISIKNVRRLTYANEKALDGLIGYDINIFSNVFSESFDAHVGMFPKMMNDKIAQVINKCIDKDVAYNFSGVVGGGYLILIIEKEINSAIRIRIRVKDYWI
jgi:hypothetical protein